MIESFVRDLRHSVRTLGRSPWLAATACATIALAIAANAMVFAVLNAVVFKPADAIDSGHLITVAVPGWCQGGECRQPPGWRDRLSGPRATIAQYGGYRRTTHAAAANGRSAILMGFAVWRDFFSTIGQAAIAGRTLDRGDDATSAAPVAVISTRIWRSWFNGDRAVLGSTLRYSDRTYTIVGVVDSDRTFRSMGPFRNDIWVPAWTLPDRYFPATPEGGLTIVARLAADTTIARARAEIGALGVNLDPSRPGTTFRIETLDPPLAVYGVAALFLVPSGLVLLLAAVSLSSLLVARAAARSGELTVRMMLGASRADVARLLVSEILLLSAGGGVLGLGLALVSGRWLQTAPLPESGGIMPFLDFAPDWRLVAFTFAATIVVGLLIASIVARRAADVAAMQSTAGSAGIGHSTRRSRSMRTRLVAIQAGAVTLLLTVGGLYIRSAMAGLSVDPALNMSHAAVGWIDYNMQGADSVRQRTTNLALLDRVRQLPGIRAAALTTGLPGDRRTAHRLIPADGASPGIRMGYTYFTTPGFVEAMGLRLRHGREIAEADRGDAVVVVSANVADRLWPGQNPVGRLLEVRGYNQLPPSAPHRVIGVTEPIEATSLDPNYHFYVFVPLEDPYVAFLPQWRPQAKLALIARGVNSDREIAAQLPGVVREADSSLALHDVGTLAEAFGSDAVGLKWLAGIITFLAVLGGAMATIGLWGLIAHVAGARRREFGIRLALGATHVSLYADAARDGARMIAIGLVPGVIAALLAGRILRYYTLGLWWFDSLALALSLGSVLVVGLAACVLPVRRVLGRTPLAALRES